MAPMKRRNSGPQGGYNKRRLITAGTNFAINAGKHLLKKVFAPRQQTNAGKISSITAQQDIIQTRTKKKNYNKLKKQRAFKVKIQKALAADQELNVYSETWKTKFINSNPGEAQELYQYPANASGNLMFCTGRQYTVDYDLGYVQDQYRSIKDSTNVESNLNAKSIIAASAFKLRIHSARLNLSLTNVDATTTVPMIYDIYECVAARDLGEADAKYNEPLKCWAELLTESYSPYDATSRRPNIFDNAQSPYDCPGFGKYWKILKKTRVLLGQNQTTDHWIQTRGFTLQGDRWWAMHAIKGITKGLIIIGGIGDNSGVADGTGEPKAGHRTYQYVLQKTWHFKYETGESELPQRPTVLTRTSLV